MNKKNETKRPRHHDEIYCTSLATSIHKTSNECKNVQQTSPAILMHAPTVTSDVAPAFTSHDGSGTTICNKSLLQYGSHQTFLAVQPAGRPLLLINGTSLARQIEFGWPADAWEVRRLHWLPREMVYSETAKRPVSMPLLALMWHEKR